MDGQDGLEPDEHLVPGRRERLAHGIQVNQHILRRDGNDWRLKGWHQPKARCLSLPASEAQRFTLSVRIDPALAMEVERAAIPGGNFPCSSSLAAAAASNRCASAGDLSNLLRALAQADLHAGLSNKASPQNSREMDEPQRRQKRTGGCIKFCPGQTPENLARQAPPTLGYALGTARTKNGLGSAANARDRPGSTAKRAIRASPTGHGAKPKAYARRVQARIAPPRQPVALGSLDASDTAGPRLHPRQVRRQHRRLTLSQARAGLPLPFRGHRQIVKKSGLAAQFVGRLEFENGGRPVAGAIEVAPI